MSIAPRFHIACLAAITCLLAAVVHGADDSSFAQAFGIEAVDLSQCAVFIGDREEPATPLHERAAEEDYIRQIFGLRPKSGDNAGWPGYRAWKVKDHPQYKAPVVWYRVTFKKPVAIGATSIHWREDRGGSTRLYYLRADGAYPGQPNADGAWQEVEQPAGQRGPFYTFAPGVKTRAVLLRHDAGWGSSIGAWRFYKRRLFDIRHAAIGQGERAPGAADGMNLARGTRWINAWPRDENSPVYRNPISDVYPSWVILSWDQPYTVCGVMVDGNIRLSQPFVLREDYAGNPALQPSKAWKPMHKPDSNTAQEFSPIATKAVKLSLMEVDGDQLPGQNQVAVVSSFRVFTDLGDAPIPALAVPSAAGEPAYAIPYTVDRSGDFALSVDDADGVRMRNLVAQVHREPGSHELRWDLKDEDGRYVQPGTYRWKAVIGPRPEVRYEMTVYPNIEMNSPQNSPWLNGHSGTGGWLADHSGNSSITINGDSVFIGAWTAESGVAMIETDLDGNKLWGRHNLAAWAGPRLLANDGENIYASTRTDDSDTIWRIDAARETSTYMKLDSTRLRHNGLQSMAIRDGKLYLAMTSPRRDWIVNAANASEVDMEHVVPLPPKEVKEGKEEFRPDPRLEFLRLLRLTMDPGGHQTSGQVFLNSERGPGRKQHIVIPFTSALPLGSLIYSRESNPDYTVTFSILKADAPYPPDQNVESQWQTVGKPGAFNWDVLPLPEKTVTRAIRVSFIKGGEDELMDALAAADGDGEAKLEVGATGDDMFGGRDAWQGRIEGLKIVRRRFAGLQAGMTIRVNSGTVDDQGWWDAQRSEVITAQNPGIYVMQWDSPQDVRGLNIREIDGMETRIDVYTGPATGEIPLAGSEHWQEVGVYKQQLRDFYIPTETGNPLARYMDGYVDFHETYPTRAVRLRVVHQRSVPSDRPKGIRDDLGGRDIDPARCRIWGVTPVRYLGGEVPVDPMSTDRIEVRDLASKKLLQEIPLAVDGPLRFTPAGELLARQKGTVVRVDLTAPGTTPLISDIKAGTFCVDGDGRLYVYDPEKSQQVVRVYDAAGKYLHSVGTPGGWQAGPWEPTRLGQIMDLAVDKRGQLWMVESSIDPKRVTLWGHDGSFIREFLGNTNYGGGGILNRYDKSNLVFGRMAFEIDWQTGKSRLKNLNFMQTYATGGHGIADLTPLKYEGQTYLVSGVSHPSMAGDIAFVFLQEENTARLVASFGQATEFEPLQRPDFIPLLQGKVAGDYDFIYADLNGDGEVQPSEVTLSPATGEHGKRVYGFDYDMACNSNRHTRYVVDRKLENGTLVFREIPLKAVQDSRVPIDYVRRLRNGNYFVKQGGSERGEQDFNAVVDPEGKVLWRYPRQYEGVQSLRIYPWAPGWVTHQFIMIGNETVPGDLGEVFVVNSNCGQWNVWTADGLLVGEIFHHKGDPDAQYQTTAHERGMLWDNLSMGQEHFSGSFTKTEADGKTYVVSGHNFISVAEVKGWEKFKRLSGEITVTGADIQAARQWELERAAQELYVKAEKLEINPGNLESVMRGEPTAHIGAVGAQSSADIGLAYDAHNLYASYAIYRQGPLANGGNDWHLYFKTGAAVELSLGTDSSADPDRQSPVAGDIRLLMTQVDGKAQVVLYAPKAPGASAEEGWETSTPAGGRAVFERVRLMPEVTFYHEIISDRGVVQGYRATAVIPLASIGLEITPGMAIKLDWGTLVSDNGTEVRTRSYWSNTAATGTSDAPTEARLHPNLWGTAIFATTGTDAIDKFGGGGQILEEKAPISEEEMENELEGL